MSLRHAITGSIILLVLWGCSLGRMHAPLPITPVAATPAGVARVISFDDLALGTEPAGFLCAAPGPAGIKPAKWQVIDEPEAPGNRVLEQSDGDDTNHRYPVALAREPLLADLTVAVRAKAVRGGDRDRSFGVVLRAADERNYYVARANTSGWGTNVRFYKFVDGKRTELEEWDGEVTPGVWHILAVSAVGPQFTIVLDGKPVLRVEDATFAGAGMAGVWTKAESVSRFDDLSITALTPTPPAEKPAVSVNHGDAAR